MAENLSGSALFAGRYRFQPVSSDWDRGRSGYTSPIYDETAGRKAVIKRAETVSKRLTEELKSEEKALKALDGLGVPAIFDRGHADYESRHYEYLVIEYIDGQRVEKSLDALSNVERADIITQFFGLLSQAHQKGIVNGDVDLKHLFWRNANGKKQLVVIDWGNARLGNDPKKKTEFAYDLARSAEIIFSLVSYQGHPPATGSIALPDSSGIRAGLEPLPKEFRQLCAWAPRTPSDGAQAPYTAKEMFDVSKQWLDAIQNAKVYKQRRQPRALGLLGTGIAVIAGAAILLFSLPVLFNNSQTTPEPTDTAILATTELVVPIDTTVTPWLTETVEPTPTLTRSPTLTTSPTWTPTETLSPSAYSSFFTFDRAANLDQQCWRNEPVSNFTLRPAPDDGFSRRADRNWAFSVSQKHSTDEIVQVDFSECIGTQQIGALALNVWILRLDQHVSESSREFGIFIENESGQRREYTLLLDKKDMFLRIREGDGEPQDFPVDKVNPANIKLTVGHPRSSSSFRIMLFLEINNQGTDILYLLEGPLGENISPTDIDPSRMFPVAKLPTLGDVQKIGLVGHGGKTETLIWPLTLLERTNN